MEFWFILAVVMISILAIMVYAAIAVFFPEWVGITGKAAKSAEESHIAGSKESEWFDTTK